MICLFSGGSGSGKSELAERCAVRLSQKKGAPLLYFATMRVWDEEGERRVQKHRAMREGRGFVTVESPSRLRTDVKDSVVLLECLSNRLANAMFGDREADPVSLIRGEIEFLSRENDVVIVTNEVFSDGQDYERETAEYVRLLGRLNCLLAQAAQLVVESVYGIPVVHKGELV